MAKQTYTKEERKAQFLKAGVALAKKDGLAAVSVAAVAKKCNVTAPLVFHVFGTRTALQAAIKREAKKQGVTLVESKVAKKPTRKRSIAEVRAIKDKAASPTKGAQRPAKAGSRAPSAKQDSPKPAGTGKKANGMVLPETVIGKKNVKALRAADKKANAAKKQPSKKYPTNPTPQIAMPDEPKASL
jgi:hypothetical protein